MAKCDSLPHGQRAGSLQQGDFAIAILQLIRTQDAGAGPASHMLQVPEQIGRGPPSPGESGLHQLRRRPRATRTTSTCRFDLPLNTRFRPMHPPKEISQPSTTRTNVVCGSYGAIWARDRRVRATALPLMPRG